MDPKKLPELAKLMDLCRKKGVESIKFSENGYEFKLAPSAPKSNYKKKQSGSDLKDPETPIYTEEEALFWSSEGLN
jgi:hypothetical protein